MLYTTYDTFNVIITPLDFVIMRERNKVRRERENNKGIGEDEEEF